MLFEGVQRWKKPRSWKFVALITVTTDYRHTAKWPRSDCEAPLRVAVVILVSCWWNADAATSLLTNEYAKIFVAWTTRRRTLGSTRFVDKHISLRYVWNWLFQWCTSSLHKTLRILSACLLSSISESWLRKVSLNVWVIYHQWVTYCCDHNGRDDTRFADRGLSNLIGRL